MRYMSAQEEPPLTDRAKLGQELRRSSEQLKGAVESMRDGAVIAGGAKKADGTADDMEVQGLSDDIHLLYEELRDVYNRVAGMVADVELSERE